MVADQYFAAAGSPLLSLFDLDGIIERFKYRYDGSLSEEMSCDGDRVT